MKCTFYQQVVQEEGATGLKNGVTLLAILKD